MYAQKISRKFISGRRSRGGRKNKTPPEGHGRPLQGASPRNPIVGVLIRQTGLLKVLTANRGYFLSIRHGHNVTTFRAKGSTDHQYWAKLSFMVWSFKGCKWLMNFNTGILNFWLTATQSLCVYNESINIFGLDINNGKIRRLHLLLFVFVQILTGQPYRSHWRVVVFLMFKRLAHALHNIRIM